MSAERDPRLSTRTMILSRLFQAGLWGLATITWLRILWKPARGWSFHLSVEMKMMLAFGGAVFCAALAVVKWTKLRSSSTSEDAGMVTR
jgi:hypothetical protein